jgi:hypothetical protein
LVAWGRNSRFFDSGGKAASAQDDNMCGVPSLKGLGDQFISLPHT